MPMRSYLHGYLCVLRNKACFAATLNAIASSAPQHRVVYSFDVAQSYECWMQCACKSWYCWHITA